MTPLQQKLSAILFENLDKSELSQLMDYGEHDWREIFLHINGQYEEMEKWEREHSEKEQG